MRENEADHNAWRAWTGLPEEGIMERWKAFAACLSLGYLIAFHLWAETPKRDYEHVRYFDGKRHIVAKWKLGGPISVMWE